MFLRNEIQHFAKGTCVVPFCKKCGSHNITVDLMDDRSRKVEYDEKEVKIYKCDKCGKEFSGFKVDNIISYGEGNFEYFKCNDEYFDYMYYHIDKYLCEECKKELTNKLNLKLREVYNTDNVSREIEKFLGGM